MHPTYHRIDTLLGFIDEPYRAFCQRIVSDHLDRFRTEPGSSHNHQAWAGGYLDHITEVMNLACILYAAMSAARPLPFSLSDALLVLFLHDLEKPWRFHTDEHGNITQVVALQDKGAKAYFREAMLVRYGITLTTEQQNAFKYVEGEGEDYSSERRVMNELAGFCHLCDTASARIWHNHPRAAGDPWLGADRSAVR